MNEFELFVVSGVEDGVLAVLPNQALIAPIHRQQLSREFYLLCESGYPRITLDLTALDYISSSFLGQLFQFATRIRYTSSKLSVQVSPDVAELMKVTMLDKVIHII